MSDVTEPLRRVCAMRGSGGGGSRSRAPRVDTDASERLRERLVDRAGGADRTSDGEGECARLPEVVLVAVITLAGVRERRASYNAAISASE